MKRSPMPPRRRPLEAKVSLAGGGQLRRAPVRKRKSKRAADFDAEFATVRPSILERDGHRCQFHRRLAEWLAEHPDGDIYLAWRTSQCDHGLEVHHIVRRSQGGTNDPSNLVTLCPHHHHAVVHANPDFGRAVGLLARRMP